MAAWCIGEGLVRTVAGARMVTVLIDGVSYGMLLFVLSSGLAVTLGLMNVINLAHGSLAMAGGYATVLMVNRVGVPFFAALPLAFAASAVLGGVLERTLYRHVYGKSHLDQVLFTIGLVFMSIAIADYYAGSSPQFLTLPDVLMQRFTVGPASIGAYRLLIIILCGTLTLALQWVLSRTRFGSQLRAAVDDARVAGGLGISVRRVFSVSFAVGSGLAGLGGALASGIVGLDPSFPVKFMIYFLIVVAIGGSSSIAGPFLAAILLGIADVAGKYYVPSVGSFVIYTVMIALLVVRPQGLLGRSATR